MATAERMLADTTPPQRAFITDTTRQKAALCSRRSGKTVASTIALLYTAVTKPGSVSLYINTSRRECRNLVWTGPTGLLALNTKYGLKAKSNETYLRLEFPNGSEIRLIGVDDARELEKLRGDAYDLVIIDEAQKLPELKYFCTDVLFPATLDRLGTIILTGTPSAACKGYFFEITKPSSKMDGWGVHSWSFKDNYFLPHAQEEALRIKKANSWDDDHPTWLREYCSVWVQASELLVYAYHLIPEGERFYRSLPTIKNPRGEEMELDWYYICGVDLGWNDFAYSIWAYSDHHPNAYEIESKHFNHLSSEDQYEVLVALTKRFSFTRMVVDAGNNIKATVIDWQERGLPVDEAVKKDKQSYIARWNAAMMRGTVRFREFSPLVAEMQDLQWLKDTAGSERQKEDPRYSNHVADSALYAWKEALNWGWEEKQFAPLPGSPAAISAEEQSILDALTRGEDREPTNYYERLEGLLN